MEHETGNHLQRNSSPVKNEENHALAQVRARSASNKITPTIKGEDPQKHMILEVLTEFIESGDVNEAVADVESRVTIEGIEFVKRALIFGIEHNAYERELISKLLSAVYNIFHMNQLTDGYQQVLDRLTDLVLDVPDAAEVLGKFISRGMYDEILPPKFIKESKVHNPHAQRALSLAAATIESPDRKRLDHIWGPGDLSSIERLRNEVDLILKEYLENRNINDAVLSVRALNAPSFNSQILKQALVLSLEKNNNSARDSIISLIEGFLASSLVSNWDVKHSFELTWRRIADLKLDIPNSEKSLEVLTEIAKEKKFLGKEFQGKEH